MEHVVNKHIKNKRTLTLRDFMEFLQRSRWKLTRSKKGRDSVGNYLSVMDRGGQKNPQTIVIFEQQDNCEPPTGKSYLSKLDYRIGEHDEEGM